MNTDRTDRTDLGTEAAHWLLRLEEHEDGDRERFLGWITQSPRHVEVFLETFETYRLLGTMDPARALDVEEMLRNVHEDVIRLPLSGGGGARKLAGRATPRRAAIAAAAVLVLAGCAWLWMHAAGSGVYETAVGEQRICKLEDGSFVYLNTDSRIRVSFSDTQRTVRLERGEALFSVGRGAARPFVVSTPDASIRVLGTQFNVRRRAGGTDVAVLEGSVQITSRSADATAAMPPLRSGEEARVDESRVSRKASASPQSVLAWRSRRLAFTEAPLEDVAAEFNRYNEKKIRIEGGIGASRRLTGIFDADRPSALVMYAMKDESLLVEPKEDEWIIKAR